MRGVFAVLVLSAAPAVAQWVNYPTAGIPRTKDGKPNLAAPAPKTPDGKPDFSGIWQAHDGRYLNNLAADGVEVPMQPWAAKLLRERQENQAKDRPSGECLPHSVTDFDAHALWLYRGVDWYFVACEETRAHLAALGIPRETIHVTGIPISPAFAVPLTKREARRGLALDPDRTTVLVSAGGFGMGPVEALVGALQAVRHPVQLAVVCGRNAALERRLKAVSGPHPMRVVGYTTEMDRWMAAADLLVGKAGGLTSSEALARGLVLVVVNPIPGQEERNSDHFLEEGVAIRCNNLPALAFKLDTLLDDPGRLARMREAVNRLARPQAAADIVAIVRRQHGEASSG